MIMLTWEHNCMCQLSKVPSTDIQKFLSRRRSKSVFAQHHFAKISAGSGRIMMTPGEGTLGGDQCCKNT
ncbi:unnamed protein product, partial [Tenebrio molitor]